MKDILKIVGTQAALSELTGIPQQTISRWLTKDCIPLNKIDKLCKAVDGKIKRQRLIDYAVWFHTKRK